MTLICLSFSHHHSPIQFRERVFFDSDAISNTCARFRAADTKPPGLIEYTILSTCNRTEFYGFLDGNSSNPSGILDFKSFLFDFFSDARNLDLEELAQYGKWLVGIEVAEHLCRVSAGLESLVLGEPQILGQVGDALRLGASLDSAGAVIGRLFQDAIRAGRRAREETKINTESTNVPVVAANVLEHELKGLQGKTVGVLGAGEMAELAVDRLRKRGLTDVCVVNRSLDKARELSDRYEGRPYVFEQLSSVLSQVDGLLSSTGAPHTLVTKDIVASAMMARPQRKLVIVDIALPRDVEPTVDQLNNVVRFDIDDLNVSIGHAISMRQDQIQLVETIVGQELENFLRWFRSIGVEPVIGELRRRAESIRANEVERLLKHENLDREVVERFSKTLVKKLFHDPTTQLRAQQGSRGAVDFAEAVNVLFMLEASQNAESNDSGVSDGETVESDELIAIETTNEQQSV